ncbi:hypothetical protein E2C06_34070 [Dankookia rubra]|uniref:Uncharacterized protein n=1 Tax=Dankookia rubra TaxID=1442381 RepID=A0A4R5Q6J2_9PROT|nr:hypothetical protein [Dankookia rubra]TDH58163.1 hypothetical protein E2C06_34070 [Dankookia rubra]
MAFISVDQPARARLAAMRRVSVLDRPLHHDQTLVAMVMAGVRCMDIRAEGDTYRVDLHLRLGKWLPLADGVTEEAAFAAVLAFVSLVASVPQEYAPEHDAAECAAAAEVYAAFASPLSIAA